MDTKVCSSCRETKSVSCFSKSASRGYQTYCKKCANAKRAQWARDNTEKTRRYAIKYKYGITDDDFETLLIQQGGRCAICKKEFDSRPHIDHDHTTGTARGLLCQWCNIFVGYLESGDLSSALQYLNKYK